MEEKTFQDDFDYYFHFKSGVDQDELLEVKSKKDLTKKLTIANKMLENAQIPVKANLKYKIPTNREIEQISKWKSLEQADTLLTTARKTYEVQIKEYDNRWREIENRQTQLKSNLVRYNNFVREKQGKVADGISRTILERKRQSHKKNECKNAEEDFKVHKEAKGVLNDAVLSKRVYKDYLDSVVEVSSDEYPDMQQLIDRCQALVDTRNCLTDHLKETNRQTEEQEQSLEKFKETKMKQTLNYNIKQTDLQRVSDAYVVKTQANKRTLGNIEESVKEKKVEISNIKLAIQNMYNYANRRAVTLHGDTNKDTKDQATIEEQLLGVVSHIEDLEDVNKRVRQSDAEKYYDNALPSTKSTIRMGY